MPIARLLLIAPQGPPQRPPAPIGQIGRQLGLQLGNELRGLMRFVTNVSKLVILMLVVYLVLAQEIPRLSYVTMNLGERLAHESWWLFLLGIKLSVVIGIVAAADLGYGHLSAPHVGCP